MRYWVRAKACEWFLKPLLLRKLKQKRSEENQEDKQIHHWEWMLCQGDVARNFSEREELHGKWWKIQTWSLDLWWCRYYSVLLKQKEDWPLIWVSAEWSDRRNDWSVSDDLSRECDLWRLTRSEIRGTYQEWSLTADHQSCNLRWSRKDRVE